jgi:hypothetical protein
MTFAAITPFFFTETLADLGSAEQSGFGTNRQHLAEKTPLVVQSVFIATHCREVGCCLGLQLGQRT